MDAEKRVKKELDTFKVEMRQYQAKQATVTKKKDSTMGGGNAGPSDKSQISGHSEHKPIEQ